MTGACYDLDKSCYDGQQKTRFRSSWQDLTLGAHVGRGRQQTKAVNRKNGGLKQNFWAAKAPLSNWGT
jgi:hypothetical protein